MALPTFVATLPTFLGLVAYAFATYADARQGTATSIFLINPVADMSSDKSAITLILICSHVVEQILPPLSKVLRKGLKKMIKNGREGLKRLMLEVFRESTLADTRPHRPTSRPQPQTSPSNRCSPASAPAPLRTAGLAGSPLRTIGQLRRPGDAGQKLDDRNSKRR